MAISRANMGNEIRTSPSKKMTGNRFTKAGTPKLTPKQNFLIGKGKRKP